MKDEIIGILISCTNIWDMEASGESPVPIMKDEYIWMTQLIMNLICYREVRAYLQVPVKEYKDWPSYENMIYFLKSDYPESMILEAIEKVKNEQK